MMTNRIEITYHWWWRQFLVGISYWAGAGGIVEINVNLGWLTVLITLRRKKR